VRSESGCGRILRYEFPESLKADFNPDSAVQSETAIKRRALRREDNRPVVCSGLQAPVAAADFRKIISFGRSTIDSIEIVRFYAFAPPGSTLDRYTGVYLRCVIRVECVSLRS
jgi:hypothetical protein